MGRKPPPACYAMVLPGLEPIAAAEIEKELGAEIKRTGPGLVVFRCAELGPELLELRTTEDVFLMAWGTDQLSHRAKDQEKIRKWTAQEPDWDQLLQLHHAIHPKPKGKPTFHLVTQMTGTHGYRRIDAQNALAQGLAGKIPASWREADENASFEVWLTIHDATAVCGVRLSDRTMRHRTWKIEHRPASLRPTLAAAMVHLAELKPGLTILDPMCGAGTLLAETMAFANAHRLRDLRLLGGDIEKAAVRAATDNIRRLGQAKLECWNATKLPIDDASVDLILSNPPFGKQLSQGEDLPKLYGRVIGECQRVLRPGGKAVLIVGDFRLLQDAARAVGWKMQRQLRVRVLGQPGMISVWKKK